LSATGYDPEFLDDPQLQQSTVQDAWTITARWVFPVHRPPLEGGLVTLRGDRIVAVQPRGAGPWDVDLGQVALLPGFVNAHTHLDLSGLRGLVSYQGSFTRWLQAVIHHRRTRTPTQVFADVQAGLQASLASGVTLLGDIAAGGTSWSVVARAPVRAVVFYELLGLPRDRAGQAWAGCLDWLGSHPATTTCRPGLSPHAPYSVRASLFAACANLARARRLPLATHLMETAEEGDLLQSHQGPFVDFLDQLGVWDPSGFVPEIQALLHLNQNVSPTLYAHGNYLDPGVTLSPGSSIIYCPRTHAFFQHPNHPFRTLLDRGVRIALGTDSLASNPDLSILEEARFLHRRQPDLPGSVLLSLFTRAGAAALGWAHEVGTLEPGKSADLVVLPLPSRQESDPHRLLFDSTCQPLAVLWRGRWVQERKTTDDTERREE
jgi:cytosine/adenosine deaminase-related metal-dependent hydrolase